MIVPRDLSVTATLVDGRIEKNSVKASQVCISHSKACLFMMLGIMMLALQERWYIIDVFRLEKSDRSKSSFLVALHSVDPLIVCVLLETGVKASPPVKEESIADELEPRCELEAGVLKELLETVRAAVLSVPDLVRAGGKVDVGFDEQNVVD